jgi:hypothetical protein
MKIPNEKMTAAAVKIHENRLHHLQPGFRDTKKDREDNASPSVRMLFG